MKQLVAVLAVALLGAVGGAFWLWRQMDAQQQQIAGLQARIETMEQQPQRAATAALPQAQGATATATPAGAEAPPVTAAVKPDQQAREMTRTILRASLAQMYPDLGEELGLRPDELDKFFDLLVSQRLGDSPAGADRHKADEQAIEAMLGSRYPQWQEYQQTLPGRVQVNQLRGQLAASGSTLKPAQARPLMAALNAEEKRVNEDAQKNPPPRSASPQEQMDQELQRAADGNHRMVEAAKPYLDAQQLDSYRQMLDRQTELVRSMLKGASAIREQSGKPN